MLYSFETTHLDQRSVEAPGEPSNEQLMELVQQRDEQALRLLFARHRVLLRTIISRIVPSDADCEDVLQDCMLDTWKHAESYDPAKGQAMGWLVTLARRRGIDRVRRNGAYARAQERLRTQNGGSEADEVHCGADEEVAQGDRANAMARLIENLPPAQQEVVRLTYFGGLSQREIAKHTGIPLGTIKTRLELALRKLKSAALAYGELQIQA
jgi:RNA polymerase sigma-70 factor (ECF subfamily)